jgi:hypothetical protein
MDFHLDKSVDVDAPLLESFNLSVARKEESQLVLFIVDFH